MHGLWDAIREFFQTRYLSPHGMCLLWRPELLWTHAVSDMLIGTAYFSIPMALASFARQRRDIRFGWVLWMFVAFILLCGMTHFMAVWTLWTPDYGIEALVKVATAIVSLATAIALWPLLPRAVALPSTARLEASLAERDAALSGLRSAMDTMMEMREHEARQKMLLDELNHRVKNSLAAVQSIASQTFHEAHGVQEAHDLFLERLMALSGTHNLLVKHEWEGARLRELVDATLSPYGRDYVYAGPDLRLDANLAVSLGMALHELATNAVKYGAWRGEGRISVTIVAEAGHDLRIVWRESGGPKVRTPARRGFGSRLLERGIALELQGSVELDFAETGLVCTIIAPISERLAVAPVEPA